MGSQRLDTGMHQSARNLRIELRSDNTEPKSNREA
jgi:hypothetical protein